MKWIGALVLLVTAVQMPTLSPFCLMAQRLQQEPGNPGHQEPPKDFFCSSGSTDKAKACACHRVDTSKSCEGEPTEDNAKCKSACFKQHCHCKVVCQPGGDEPQ